MHLDWFTFIAQIINFLILLALLQRFLYKPVLRIMDKRAEEVAGRLEEARKKLDQAEEKSKLYEEKLRDFEHQKSELLKSASEEAERKRDALIREARDEVDRLRQQWKESVEIEKDSYFNELYRQTANRVIEIVDRIIRDLSNRDLEQVTIDKFIEQLHTIDNKEQKRIIHSALNYGNGKLKIISSFTLSDEQQKRIEDVLQEVFSMSINCEFVESKVLGFGIEIQMTGWKLGWNMMRYLEELRKNIKQTGKNTYLAAQTIL
ncbi:MAG TPA: F0F1 ATP synthase subunit B [Balneolaceae bacterium]|nr:F0F1 ATP synthase subunit B [Balneolaceae bacterium]